MKVYQPLQHLSYIETIDSNQEKIPFLKSTIKVLMNEGENLARIYNEKDPLLIIYKTVRDQQWPEKHIFDDTVLIDRVPNGPGINPNVKVIVYKMDGSVGGQVTTTISGDAEIEDE